MKTAHGNTQVGGSGGEYTKYDQTSSYQRFYVNNNEVMRLDSSGNLYLDGSTSINFNFSDRRLKTNIQKIANALETVMKLNGVTYDWRLGGKSSAGVIAQEVENTFPSAVGEKLSISHNDEIFKTVEYSQLIGLLIEAVKDLNRENQKIRSDMENRGLFIEAIKELKQEIEDLKAKNADILKMIN
jgi:beta-xylosidase